jgi:hypothetical protein
MKNSDESDLTFLRECMAALDRFEYVPRDLVDQAMFRLIESANARLMILEAQRIPVYHAVNGKLEPIS